jgi:Secretion system C-terminal sorting domain
MKHLPANLEIFDILGDPVYSAKIEESHGRIEVDLARISQGLYLTRVSNREKIILSEKIIKIK